MNASTFFPWLLNSLVTMTVSKKRTGAVGNTSNAYTESQSNLPTLAG